VSARDFHELNRIRHEDWPYEMLATSTHDTKLGEDVRVRVDVLSEMPDDWGREASRWMRLNRGHRTIVDGEPAPDRNDEYRFYQALTGVWPPGADAASAELVERLQAYMLKAVKESKQHSSWINPNEPYEEAVSAFVRTVLTGAGGARFLPSFVPFAARVARSGLVNSLSQVALKIASPGVPDFYQGSERWDLTLVDPDNRHPVDFEARARSLADAETVLALPADRRGREIARLLREWADGTIKQLVTKAALALRADAPELFLEGAYLPLDTETTIPGSVIAFARLATAGPEADAPGRAAIVIAPHLVTPVIDAEHPLPLGDRWKTSRVFLPAALGALTYRDVFTGADVRPTTSSSGAWLFVGQVLEHLPVALLESRQ
jgi:(1->4)-alpha-D-glucan 1-alpha-D-glucosylmutase